MGLPLHLQKALSIEPFLMKKPKTSWILSLGFNPCASTLLLNDSLMSTESKLFFSFFSFFNAYRKKEIAQMTKSLAHMLSIPYLAGIHK